MVIPDSIDSKDMTEEILSEMQKEYRLKISASRIPNFIIPTAQERAYLDDNKLKHLPTQ